MKKYIQKVVAYKIEIPRDYLLNLKENIESGVEIKIETIGYLVGMAIPIFENIKCIVCGKDVEVGTEHKQNVYEDRFSSFTKGHEVCYQKELAIKNNKEFKKI